MKGCRVFGRVFVVVVVGEVEMRLAVGRGRVMVMRMENARLVDFRVKMAMGKGKTWLSAGRARSCAFVGLRKKISQPVLEMAQAHQE